MTPTEQVRPASKLPLVASLAVAGAVAAWIWVVLLPSEASRIAPALLGLFASSVALVAFLSQRRLGENTSAELSRTLQLLTASQDAPAMALEIWDEHDRLVLYNRNVELMGIDNHRPGDIGRTFEALLRARLERQQVPAAVGREEDWLKQRLMTRASQSEPRLKEYEGNRWFRTCETRTANGYLVVSWVDVSDLVRKGQELEAVNSRLTLQTSMDELTGLANRRRFDAMLANEWQRAARKAAPLSLLMVDIDHFKQFNDHYGHIAGDECLQQVSKILGSCVRRAGEMVARYGGEEFVVLLPGANLAHARETAQRCIDEMKNQALPHAASRVARHVTLSIGVACTMPSSARSPASMINAADAAMYRAKTGGRARFEVADRGDWEIEKDTPRTQPAPLI
jgi:diguanylate cyclase (GGDEF)-like protein